MIVEYLRYTVPADRADAFVAAYAAARDPLLDSGYCTVFDLCRCVEDPTRFILRLEWTSAEDHMKRFRGSDAFRRFFAHVRPFVDLIDEMRHYDRIMVARPG
ncbi:putative quinol monooxygenase [Jannaschia sp. LMIT008]|uniref:putative quinol monooxygenase n=1 Tax=Jannaschia maritima TaxID=3032585 RepID=UPI0028115E03|nr:antibiotic biosynthesis monooxygenase [Jannaschia sp. LMIT008]